MKMIKKVGVVALIIILSSIVAIAQPGKVMYHTMIMVETHSEDGNDDDFSYQMLSISRELQKNIIGNLFYMHKINISEDSESNGGIFGVNLSEIINKKLSANLGYQFTQTPRTTRNPGESVDRDRWSLNLRYTLAELASGLKLKSSTSFSTNTDWDEGRILGEEISAAFSLTDALDSEIGVQYNYSLSSEDSIYNAYSLKLNYKLNKKSKINFGYQFIQKLGDLADASDDDNVIRIGYLQAF